MENLVSINKKVNKSKTEKRKKFDGFLVKNLDKLCWLAYTDPEEALKTLSDYKKAGLLDECQGLYESLLNHFVLIKQRLSAFK